jgi:transcriptional regulator with XRE-family HTH domain
MHAEIIPSESELCFLLGVNVRALRTAALLTVQGAAKRAGLHWRHWQKIEAGEINATLLTLTRLAHALNVTPDVLLRSRPVPVAECASTPTPEVH